MRSPAERRQSLLPGGLEYVKERVRRLSMRQVLDDRPRQSKQVKGGLHTCPALLCRRMRCVLADASVIETALRPNRSSAQLQSSSQTCISSFARTPHQEERALPFLSGLYYALPYPILRPLAGRAQQRHRARGLTSSAALSEIPSALRWNGLSLPTLPNRRVLALGT